MAQFIDPCDTMLQPIISFLVFKLNTPKISCGISSIHNTALARIFISSGQVILFLSTSYILLLHLTSFTNFIIILFPIIFLLPKGRFFYFLFTYLSMLVFTIYIWTLTPNALKTLMISFALR